MSKKERTSSLPARKNWIIRIEKRATGKQFKNSVTGSNKRSKSNEVPGVH